MTTKTKLHPIFAECVYKACGKLRYDIHRPFSVGGHYYATNGAIAVRTPRDRPYTSKGNLPPIQELPWDNADWPEASIADLGEPGTVVCRRCEGTGQIRPHETCEYCIGTGWAEAPLRITDAVWLSQRYIIKLLAHGVETVRAGDEATMAAFTGDGFEGLVMGCIPPTPEARR
jgi:hypothetical protein